MSSPPTAASPLPTGVVTFLFTDIEGSTKLVHDLGDTYAEVLNRHNRLLRDAFSRHGGVEVVTTGDGFFVAFPQAAQALAAALESQGALTVEQWPHDAGVRVRMGLHTGQAMVVDDDYVGLDVHRAARIMGAAHGGQVVISDATAALVDETVPLKDLGLHRLKGLQSPEHIFQALIDGLRSDFPPIRSLEPPTNLPRSTASIVGRTTETDHLREILDTSEDRLVTITGIGGIGKTRLALHVASGLLERFVDGIFFVDVTDLTEGSDVAMAIEDALASGAAEATGSDVVVEIGSKRILLVLDNFEQAIRAAPLVSALLAGCPNLRVIVTSQVALRIAGEIEFPLVPLHPPDDVDVESVMRSEAAQLFASRAAAIRPGFEISSSNASAVAQICRLLDGLPLALELAAARTKVLSPQEVVGRLDDRLKLLTGGARDAPSRHQTLRATLDWSYGLLPPEDRAFFRDFSVFAGGATVGAIEEVLEASGDPLDRLSALVEHSLIRRIEGEGSTRFSMLQSIRAYAMALLEETADRDAVRDRHADHYLRFAEEQRQDAGHSLDADHENIRAALERWLERAESGDNEAGNAALRLAIALGQFWYMHGRAQEGIVWYERALAAAHDPPIELRADATRGVGVLLEATRDLKRARDLFEEALGLYRSAGSKRGEAASLNSLGVAMRSLGDPAAAESFFERAMDLQRERGDDPGLSKATSNLGITAVDHGDLDRAESLFQEALQIDRRLDDRWGVAVDLHNLSVVALERGKIDEANHLVAEGLEGFSSTGDLDGVAEALEVSAGIAGATGDHVGAVRLAAAASVLRDDAGLPATEPDRARLERWLVGSRAALSQDLFGRAWEEGAAMTLQQATRYAARRAGRSSDDSP